MVGSAEAAQAAQIAQLKEDLYSDLTGLLLRGVEKGAEENVYDCIQTGRNGSKSFNTATKKSKDAKSFLQHSISRSLSQTTMRWLTTMPK